MKWKSDNSDKVWSVRLLMDGGRASVAQLKCGDETIQSNVTITYDKQSDNIYVNEDGNKLKSKDLESWRFLVDYCFWPNVRCEQSSA